jgi:hypothetical protein
LHPPLLPKPAAFLHPRNLVAASPRCVPPRPQRETNIVVLVPASIGVIAPLPRCDFLFSCSRNAKRALSSFPSNGNESFGIQIVRPAFPRPVEANIFEAGAPQ